MSSETIKKGDTVLCPRGLGEAILLQKGAQPDIREPPDPDLCKVRLKRRCANPIRYFSHWQLSKVDFSNVPDENADYVED